MAIVSSGEIKFSDIATEYGDTLSNLSLTTLSTNIGLTPQHAISEFYGRSSEITIDDLTNTITTDDGGASLDINPEDAIYFGGHHFISNANSPFKSYYSNDDGITWTFSYTLFDTAARFTLADDYMISVGFNNVTRYKFGSEPNSTSNTTYYSDLDLYRTRFALGTSTSVSRAIYYNNHVYYFRNASFYKWDVATFSGSNIGSLNQSILSRQPLAVGNDGRMITTVYSGTQAYFAISDNEFSNYTLTPIPNQNDWASYTPTYFAGAEITTNGNGIWVLTPRYIINGKTLYVYSTDNGDTWTGISDHYYNEGVMDYTLGSSQANYGGNAGDITSAYFKNNKFYFGFSDGVSDQTAGGLIFSNDGINLTGIKNIGTGAGAMSFNGSTLIVAGEDKILRFA